MTPNDRRLEDLARSAIEIGPAGECPDTDLISRLADGSLEGPEKDRLVDHLGRCPECAKEWKLARELSASLEDWSKKVARSPATRASKPWVRWAAAAAVLAGLGLAVVALLPDAGRPGPSGVLRGDGQASFATTPEDRARLTSAPRTLSWGASETDDPQSVVLFDGESRVLWTSDQAPQSQVALPDDVMATLGPGTYFWRVITHGPVEDRTSPLQTFEILP